ncbi:Adenylosuccinate synthetase [Labeo rohita]|uniref:Adenylosuccinate synthetase n=1 Tax=Labeo rohita TaxID=84645 RepID=A0ABQ8L3T3_LABRO|nr:Adenylosuccinate synthetase [Labeo rohita]
MVFHSCVDGYSQKIILNVSTSTELPAFRLFCVGVQTFGLPSRVRCDEGMENIEAGCFMLERTSLNRGSILTVRSAHNRRFERLWAELIRVTLNSVVILPNYVFISETTYLSLQDLFDPLSEDGNNGIMDMFLSVGNFLEDRLSRQ